MTAEKQPVLMVFEGLSLGGAERHIVDVATGLQRLSGRKVIVATQGGILEKELDAGNVVHEYIPGVRYTPVHLLKVARIIDKLARKHHASILHSHSRYHNLACLLATRIFRTPVKRVATAHNVYPDKHWLGFWPANTICVSSAAEKYVRGLSQANTRVILNGIPPFHHSRPIDLVRNELGIGSETIVLLNVGRLSEQKGQDLLLEAFAKFPGYPDMPALHLLIAGEGENHQQLDNNIDSLGLRHNVSLLGGRTDIGDLMAASDIFVLSSRWEGLGIALIEAASQGLPLVSFRVGGVVEVVRHGETGLLVEPGDTDALATALSQLIIDKDLRRSMGDSGLKMYAEHFTIEKCVRETDLFYSELA